jgi:SAM-dependent methyltransferase
VAGREISHLFKKKTIMGLLKSFFSQCARPEGALGRVMLSFMNYTHAPLTNWGLKLVDVQDGWTMLDVGCGGGFTIRRLLKRSKDAQVYGIDISEESVAKAKKVNAEVLDKQVFITQGSAEKLPYEDKKFDLVTAVETVYFWPNLPDCLQEVRRVLKPGGKFAILVEVVDSDSKWTSVVEGMTAYSPEDLKKLLDDAGFTQTEIYRKKPTYATILGVKP